MEFLNKKKNEKKLPKDITRIISDYLFEFRILDSNSSSLNYKNITLSNCGKYLLGIKNKKLIIYDFIEFQILIKANLEFDFSVASFYYPRKQNNFNKNKIIIITGHYDGSIKIWQLDFSIFIRLIPFYELQVFNDKINNIECSDCSNFLKIKSIKNQIKILKKI